MLILFCFILLSNNVNSEYVTVTTKKGNITGIKENGYDLFTGIPYCLVDNRNVFGPCKATPYFKEPFHAYDNRDIVCPQINQLENGELQYSGTKQCLTLNIYAPKSRHYRLPVLVWFHGESLWSGNASDYHSPYLVQREIIFIAVNFRVGPYGFFCPHDKSIPGNQALRDQVEALKWIQANIGAFEGDRNAVTIGGSGYGGSYVNLLLYSKWNHKLFEKAIIHGGSIFTYPLYTAHDRWHPVIIADYLGQATGKYTTPKDVLPFLNRVDPRKLIEAAGNINEPIGICDELPAGDKNIFTGKLFQLFFETNLLHNKILVGYNSMEMLGIAAKNNTIQFYQDAGDIIYEELNNCFVMNKAELEDVTKIVKKFYLEDKDYGPDAVLNMAEAMSDFCVNNGFEQSINKLVKGGATVYKFLFSYTGASEYRSIKGSGASQSEELKFLFDWKSPISGCEQEDIRDNMVNMWTNFVKFGNPTPEDIPLKWEPLQGTKRPYLNINTKMAMKEDVFRRRNAFWDLLWANFNMKY